MKTRVIFGLIAFLVYLSTGLDFARASTVGIELRPVNQSVKVGDTVEIEIFFMDYDPTVDVDYYAGSSISLNFDPTVISFNSWKPESGISAFSSLSAFPMQEVAPFSGNLLAPNSGLLIATANFTALNIGTSPVLVVDDLLLSTANGELAPGVILPKDSTKLNGADVNVVPLPGAVWMLGCGLVALVGMVRKS